MKKKSIGIDIDGVLADSIAQFLPYLNKMFNKNLKIEDIKKYRFEDLYGANEKQMKEFLIKFTEENKWLDIKPFSDTVISVNELKKIFNIYIVTSRPESLTKDVTIKWLDNNNIYYDNIFFLDGKCKYLTAKKMGINLSYFVEDCIELAKPIMEFIPVFIVKTPYNEGHEAKNLIYVNNLTDVVNYFKKKE